MLSFESQELDSNHEAVPSAAKKVKVATKFVKGRGGSDMFDDARPEEAKDVVDPGDIHLGERSSMDGRNQLIYESSNDEGSSNSAGHSQSQQLINFKKQISTKEMPASIIKLNRLVLAIVVVILAVVVFDTAQNYQYYKFSNQSQQLLQNLYQKHYLISKISSNILSMGIINMGLQDD